MTFCWLPPDSVPAGVAADPVRTSNSEMSSVAFLAISLMLASRIFGLKTVLFVLVKPVWSGGAWSGPRLF